MLPLHHLDQDHHHGTNTNSSPCARRPRRHFFFALLLALAVFYTSVQPVWRYLSPPGVEEHLSSGGVHCAHRSCARNPSWLIKAQHGAVASENELCSNIGVDTLKRGGNAVDAAISTTLCVGVVSMFSSGLGGGGFMTIRLPPHMVAANGSEAYTIDFRETAPLAAHETMYVGRPEAALWGGLAVGVPGELRGLKKAHDLWGTVPWAELVAPAAKLAHGWRVQMELERRISIFSKLMLNNPDWTAIFAPGGCLLREGDIIRRTALAHTLERVGAEGPDAFYRGPIADALLRKIRATGGIMTQADFDAYEVGVAPALTGTYRGKRVYTTNPPTSGPVLLHMLNLMEMFDGFVEEGRTPVNVHRMVEAMKFGFAARTRVSDPAFLGTEEVETIHQIPTKEYARKIFPNITDGRTHTPEYYQPVYDVPINQGTSHTSILDKDGMAVAITSTINLVFGSQVLDSVTGVILNDELDDFSIPGVPNAFGLYPSPYNYPQPGKRPLSSTSPTIMVDDTTGDVLVIGGSGGSRIFPAVFQTLLNVGWGADAREAIEFGRVHDQLFPTIVDVDNVYPPELVQGLRERGHNVTLLDVGRVAAVVQLIVQEGDTIYAASDSRKRGKAAGY